MLYCIFLGHPYSVSAESNNICTQTQKWFNLNSIFRSNVLVLIYLTVDAAYLGVLASVWTTAFFTEKFVLLMLLIVFDVIDFMLL